MPHDPESVILQLKREGRFDEWRREMYALFTKGEGQSLQEDVQIMLKAHILADPSLKELSAAEFYAAIEERLRLEGVYKRVSDHAEEDLRARLDPTRQGGISQEVEAVLDRGTGTTPDRRSEA